jgi:hypothetical protein
MAKSKPKRKQQNGSSDNPSKKIKITAVVTPPPENASEPKTIQSIGLEADDLEIAIDTLNSLAQNPGVIKSKACKDLRTAVYEFRQACTTGFNAGSDSNLTARVSGALADGGYTEARILLAEMRIRKQTPKLGALCRWVRDLDVVSGLAEQLGGAQRSSREAELLVVLDAILRLTGPTDYTSSDKLVSGPVIPRGAWNLRGELDRRKVYSSVLDKSIFNHLPQNIEAQFRIIETTPGLQRKPANHHPAILHASRDDAILLSPGHPTITLHSHPIVPNLHLLQDVLSPDECMQIISTAELIGFTPDAPIRAEGEEISVLAHNFYWIVDTAFSEKLWKRVEAYVPKEVGGRKVRGINRRFRVYRYVPGAEYRAHIGKLGFPPKPPLLTDPQMVPGLLLVSILPMMPTYMTLRLQMQSNPHYLRS